MKPRQNLWPQSPVCNLSNECADMLEGNALIPLVPKQLLVTARNPCKEGQDGAGRDDRAARIDDTDDWHDQAARGRGSGSDPQRSGHEAILAVQELDDLFEEAARERKLIERPALDADMRFQRPHCVKAPRPLNPPLPLELPR